MQVKNEVCEKEKRLDALWEIESILINSKNLAYGLSFGGNDLPETAREEMLRGGLCVLNIALEKAQDLIPQ